MPARILVVDDDRGLGETLQTILQMADYECAVSYNAQESLDLIPLFRPNVVITDVLMPGMTGVELASHLRNTHPEIQVIFLSGTARTEELIAEAGNSIGSMVILAKPCPPRELLRLISSLVKTGEPAD